MSSQRYRASSSLYWHNVTYVPTHCFPLLWHSACTMPDVLLRITKTTAGPVTTLKVDGELTREGVSELDKACESLDGPVDLDLTQLMKADEEGVRALKNLLDTGARLVAASLYIELLLMKEDA